MDTRVSLSGWTLDNPVIAASGAFGYGKEYHQYYDINCLGSFSFKGTTLNPRVGNPLPRIAECASGMLNAVGLQNPGARHVLAHELPELTTFFHKPVIANISGFSVDEYREACEMIDQSDAVGLIEVNISCPNVHGGGMSFGSDPKSAAAVTKAVKEAVKKPIYVKLSPNVTDITEVARACEDAGADGLSMINTLLGMRIDLKRRQPILANRTGGLSGPAVFPVALQMVYRVYEAVKIPIIGMGGISSAKDVLEMMMAGATAVQVGAANLVNPYACRDIIHELPMEMEKLGIVNLTDIIGGAHER